MNEIIRRPASNLDLVSTVPGVTNRFFFEAERWI